ncbi:hypothetical protein AB1N83_009281 [Pleurotus pulmonarius]
MKRLKRAVVRIFHRRKRNIPSPATVHTVPEEQPARGEQEPTPNILPGNDSPNLIVRLLPEILLEIFFRCHWRELAISCPSLWPMVFLPSRIAHMFVERSLDLPLTLRCNLDRSSSQLKWILNSSRLRTKHLDLRGPGEMLGPVVEKDLGECCLSSLSVVNSTSGMDDEGGLWLPDSPFIAQIYSRPMSRLKLEACAFQWDSPLYTSGLTTLHLINIPKLQRPSASRLLEIFSGLPALTNLSLVRVAPIDLEQSLGDVVPLRQLAHLRIEDQDFMCGRLLSHLDACPSVTLSIVCWKDSNPEEIDVTQIISASARYCISEPIYTCLGLVAKASGLEFYLDTLDGRYLTVLFKTSDWYPKQFGKTIMLVRHRFSVENISELHLGGKTRSSYCWPTKSALLGARRYWQTLSAFDELHVIRLNGCRPMIFLEVLFEQAMLCIGISLLPSTRHIEPDGTSRQLIKNLHSIHFDDFRFDEQVVVMGEVDFLDLLTAFLWALRRSQSRTPHIYIHRGCTGITNSRVGQLRKFTDVTWESKHCDESPLTRMLCTGSLIASAGSVVQIIQIQRTPIANRAHNNRREIVVKQRRYNQNSDQSMVIRDQGEAGCELDTTRT